ncbi:hypothetical protein RRG08_010545 [Elysia crispata]|uniref:Uncharacterized protein n=1 Tax=Elysia crispata TaxID=231223 RepID=A0AAE1AYD8_9GAST|nr:hypothetical protein RRG08_010545 [Elysia crispata]
MEIHKPEDTVDKNVGDNSAGLSSMKSQASMKILLIRMLEMLIQLTCLTQSQASMKILLIRMFGDVWIQPDLSGSTTSQHEKRNTLLIRMLEMLNSVDLENTSGLMLTQRNSSLIKFQHQEEVYLKRVDSADIQIVDCDALPQIKRETDLDEDHSICVSELEKSLTISCESVKREINEHVSFGEFIGVDESSLYGHNLLKTEGELKNGPIIATASSGFTVSQQLSEITSCQQGLVELSEQSKCGGLLTAREAYLDFSDGYDDADVIMRIDPPKEAMSIAINDSFYFPEESNFHFEAETNNANRSDVVADSHLQGGHCGGPDCSTRCLPPGTKNEAQLLSCDNIHHSDLINLACPEPTNFESREVRHLKTESQAGLHLYDVYYSNIQNIDTNSKAFSSNKDGTLLG